MQKIIRTCLTLGLLLSALFSFAQQLNPNQLTGIWEGNMKIYAFGVIRDSVDIRLTIAPKDSISWIWRTDYLSNKLPMTKDYLLIKGDSNCYITREGNGIDLINYVFGNKFYSAFETEGIFLNSSYELFSDMLIFEVTSGKKRNSVGQPIVTNYSVQYLQRALLKRAQQCYTLKPESVSKWLTVGYLQAIYYFGFQQFINYAKFLGNQYLY